MPGLLTQKRIAFDGWDTVEQIRCYFLDQGGKQAVTRIFDTKGVEHGKDTVFYLYDEQGH